MIEPREAFPGSLSAEDTFTAPELSVLYEDVRAYQRLLNETETTPEERQQLLAHLDSRWPYMNDVISVTGRVATLERRVSDTDTEGDTQEGGAEYKVKTDFFDGSVTSKGFHIYSRPQIVAGETIGDEIIIGHYFDVREEVVKQGLFFEEVMQIKGIAAIDEVLLGLDADPLSAIIRKIEYFYPNAANDIDQAVLNTSDQCSAVMALSKVEIEVGPDENKDGLGIVEQYTNVLFAFDKRVPYQFAIEGLAYLVDTENNGSLTPIHVELMDFWGYVEDIQFIPKASVSEGALIVDETSYVPGIRVEVLAQSEDDDSGRQFLLPITDAMYIASVRDDYYAKRQVA